jgi:hypothetical protein
MTKVKIDDETTEVNEFQELVNRIKDSYDYKILTINKNFRRMIKSDDFQMLITGMDDELQTLFNEIK